MPPGNVKRNANAVRTVPSENARFEVGDGRLAILVSAAALLVYWLTLFPGVTAMGDSPKFQYLGRLLGTAHDPGYPLYILLTWAFSYVPVGTVAFRVNLFSALSAAMAAGFLFLALRRLDCPRAPAAAAALGCAFGSTFWSQAVRAEVYALTAFLLSAFLFAVFRWNQTRRWPHLLLAIGIASLALGNHLTITLIAPAAVVYALSVDRRQALSARTLIVGAGLVLLGFAQYVYILVRTRQHARYLEAYAENLRQLVDVVRGSQFQSAFFGFGLHDLFAVRVPFVARLFFEELNPVGTLLLLVALGAMVWRRPKEALFLLLAAAVVVFFALTYNVPDTEVFLIPAFVLAWVAIGWGLAFVLPSSGRARVAAIVLAWLLLPGTNLLSNYRANDGHARRDETQFFRNFFRQLPPRVAIPSDANDITWMLTYFNDVEHAGRGRDVRLIPRDTAAVRRYAERGYEIYAFALARNELEEQGMTFSPPLRFGRARGDTVNMYATPVFRLVHAGGCALVGGDEWADLSDLARRGNGRLLLRLEDERRDAEVILEQEPEAGSLPPVLARPRSAAASLSSAGQLLRVRIHPEPLADMGEWRQDAWKGSVVLDLGGPPPSLRAKTADHRQAIAACHDPLVGRELLTDGDTAADVSAVRDDEVFFGRGWRLPEERKARRVASGPLAQMAIPLSAPQVIHVSVRPTAADELTPGERAEQASALTLVVNGLPQGERRLSTTAPLAWDVGRAAWRAGLNDLRLVISAAPGQGSPKLFVEKIRLERR